MVLVYAIDTSWHCWPCWHACRPEEPRRARRPRETTGIVSLHRYLPCAWQLQSRPLQKIFHNASLSKPDFFPFCDLADSTRLSQQLDPEDLRAVVRAYQTTAAEVIHRYEGHIAPYLGDGLLIYFGWPVPHEDDVPRALHVGLGIVEAITTTLNPRLVQEKDVQLAVRIGIHTGPVVVGEMGGGGRHENLATGETVNIAALLEGLAAPNTVVISAATARLVQGVFALETLGPQALKGVAEPMPVFWVLGPLEEYEDDAVIAGGPFLVGCDEEMGLLFRRWQQSKERLGQVVLVSGTAGIGKSEVA